MTEDDWLKAAMEDNDLVADLLLTIRLSSPSPSPPLPPPQPSKRRRPSPPNGWTVHQRRSRTQPLLPPPANKSEAPRASPSTPLSWNGATSISTGAVAGAVLPIADAVESSQANPNRSDISRSKVTPLSETTPTKRPRKKKTLVALKEEEALLMEEQKDLKRRLATLEAIFEKQRNENESLKKMKLNIQVERQTVGYAETVEPLVDSLSNHFEAVNERKDKIILPDLNVPVGEDAIMSY